MRLGREGRGAHVSAGEAARATPPARSPEPSGGTPGKSATSSFLPYPFRARPGYGIGSVSSVVNLLTLVEDVAAGPRKPPIVCPALRHGLDWKQASSQAPLIREAGDGPTTTGRERAGKPAGFGGSRAGRRQAIASPPAEPDFSGWPLETATRGGGGLARPPGHLGGKECVVGSSLLPIE